MGIGLLQIAPLCGRTDDYPMVVRESQVITFRRNYRAAK